MSAISAVNLLLENFAFANAWGTAPEAGIDLEPDTGDNKLVNCVIRNLVFGAFSAWYHGMLRCVRIQSISMLLAEIIVNCFFTPSWPYA